MINYVLICYTIASILMGVILSVKGHMEPIDWAVVLLAPVTIPSFLIHYLVNQLKNK
jgi:uncharacterized membrane protein YozB (DUF420 family)